jgi:hypothetical protein
MLAPAQASLPLTNPALCPTCGRDWTGVFRGERLDLAALMKLPADVRAAAARCWTAKCAEGRR